tara:strand:- start:19395 stop:19871 length:477 start_codon:yes stop_codon:yes gene_type:complete
MRRAEVIAAIEKLRTHPTAKGWRDEFAQVVKQSSSAHQDRRASFNADFQRAFIYLVILITGFRYLKKNHWEFLRPNVRSVGLALLMVLIFIVQLVVVGVIWLVTKFQPRRDIDELGMHAKCVKCNYDLSGHESVLGDEIWVGPESCSECGHSYPSVSE